MSAAHDTRVEVAGDTYWVRRDFDLIRRIEQRFGALAELDGKLRRCALTADDLVALYGVALKAQASRPSDDDVRNHVVDVGIREASEALAILILHLFAGHRRTVAWLAAEAKKDAGGGEAVPPENPLETALSIGISTLKRQGTWDGRPANSGDRPSMTSRP